MTRPKKKPEDSIAPPEMVTGEVGRITGPVREYCHMCQETFDPEKDPYHREACRDAQKP